MPILASLGAGSIGSYRLFRGAGAPIIIGSAGYTIPGTYSWVAPTGVTSVSVVAVGGGGGSGSGGVHPAGGAQFRVGGGGGSADGRLSTVMGKGATGIGGNAAVGNGTTAGSGVANLGGGGGGNYFGGDLTAGTAGNGGSGVVIIAYPDTNSNLSSIAAGLTYTYDNTSRPGYKVYKFTAGTGNISW